MKSIGFISLFFLITGLTYSIAQTGKRNVAKLQNVLADTHWKIDGIPFETKERETYHLTPLSDEQFQWGNFIHFEQNTFSSHYSAPCGMDCFTSVTGEYFFVNALTIMVKVISINRNGFCEKESEEVSSNYGNYLLSKNETGWTLTKTD